MDLEQNFSSNLKRFYKEVQLAESGRKTLFNYMGGWCGEETRIIDSEDRNTENKSRKYLHFLPFPCFHI